MDSALNVRCGGEVLGVHNNSAAWLWLLQLRRIDGLQEARGLGLWELHAFRRAINEAKAAHPHHVALEVTLHETQARRPAPLDRNWRDALHA